MFGQLHLAGTVMGAVGNIMWNSDAEDIFIETGFCKQITANKGFASAGVTTRVCANTLLRKAMTNLHTDAFEQWHLERNGDAQLSGLVDN